MKKTVFGTLTALAVIALVSCGGGKTNEQIEAEAQKKFDEKKAELEGSATQACDAYKTANVTRLRDSLIGVFNADPANAANPIVQ